MPEAVSLIATVAAAFGLALLLGFATVRIKMPAMVGYLLAGVIIGPATPGFVADVSVARQLAEIGVMLLMFGIGLHFSPEDLLAVRKIALPGAIAQMTVATALGIAVTRWWGWTLGAGLVFGLALSVASTVGLLKTLEARRLLDSPNGRIAVGWLIVQDLTMVVALVLLPAVAGLLGSSAEPATNIWFTFAVTIGQVALFIALMLLVGRRFFPWLLWQVAKTNSRELFTLCLVAGAVTIAYGSAIVFGVSFALGAFFAGMVFRESEFSQRAAEETLPLRDAFAVLFFVSVGMLFDPRVLVEQPLQVVTVIAIIIAGQSLAAAVIALLFRYPLNTALMLGASLGQIGEFSFMLGTLGVTLALLPPEGQNLIIAGALISMALNPLSFRAVAPLQRWLGSKPHVARAHAAHQHPETLDVNAISRARENAEP